MSRPELRAGWEWGDDNAFISNPDQCVIVVRHAETLYVEDEDGNGLLSLPLANIDALTGRDAPTESAPAEDVRELLAAWADPWATHSVNARLAAAIERLRARYEKGTR